MKARANKSYAALIGLIIIIFIVQCTVLCIETYDARVALAENVNQIPTDECAYFTDNDNINNSYATIRDYPELRTTPTMTFNSGEYVLETQEDDLIVNIIPKELFKVVGDKTYIGKEYGFFVHTESPAVAPLNMYSTAVIFDMFQYTFPFRSSLFRFIFCQIYLPVLPIAQPFYSTINMHYIA